MEARAQAATTADATPGPSAATVLRSPSARTATRRSSTRSHGRPVERPTALTRNQEYRYIRADLRRLLITAAALLAAMLLLLALIEF